MSGIDVRDLAGESLPENPFPVSGKSDFRLHFTPKVHQGISGHAKQDTSVEICGVLVGNWHQDEQGPFALVEDIVRCENAASKFAEVTFTHESWAQINEEMDSKHDDKRIVGWYHSHPDFGIFLSDRDCFIHEHFFSGAGQVAYVVDPVRDLEGAFAWKDNKPTPMSHYWVGNTIRTVEASIGKPGAKAPELGTTNASSPGGEYIGPSGDSGSLSFATMALAALALFLLGYLFSGWRSTWERQAIIQGVVSEYTDLKLVKLGLREELSEIQKFLASAAKAMQELPVSTNDLSEEQIEELENLRKKQIANLAGIQRRIREVGIKYGFSKEERQALAYFLAEQQRRKIEEQEKAIAKAAEKKNSDSKGSKDDNKSKSEIGREEPITNKEEPKQTESEAKQKTDEMPKTAEDAESTGVDAANSDDK